MEIATNEPTALRAGDTWAWRRDDLSDYPAPTWVLKYYFRNASAKFAVTAAADGSAHAVTVAMATTAVYAAGHYDWIAVAESATERYEVDAGRLQVLPNLATDAVYDARTFARKMLEYIESALLSRATSDQLDLVNAALADRSIARDKAGLMTLRAQFRQEVAAEDNRARMKNGGASHNRLVAVL